MSLLHFLALTEYMSHFIAGHGIGMPVELN